MRRSLIPLYAALAAFLATSGAAAQSPLLPGGSPANPLLLPPPPPPPPPPKIQVPALPQMDAPPRYNYAPAPRPSFSDRVTRCLDDGAALGLGPSDRSAYSRACANQ